MSRACLALELVEKTFSRGGMTTEILKDVPLGVAKGAFVSIIGFEEFLKIKPMSGCAGS